MTASAAAATRLGHISGCVGTESSERRENKSAIRLREMTIKVKSLFQALPGHTNTQVFQLCTDLDTNGNNNNTVGSVINMNICVTSSPFDLVFLCVC